MVSKRIKYARAHLSRRRHIAILATPNWRRTLRVDFNCLPRPYSVVRSALRARASRRIRIMAQPKHVQKKFDRTQSRMSLQYPRIHRDSIGEPSKRIFDLALPKKSHMLYARRIHQMVGNQSFKENLNSLLRGLRKSRYLKYRVICNTLHQRAAAREAQIRKKLHRALTKPSDWERHKKYLEKLAAPKGSKPPKPATSPRPKRRRRRGPLYDLNRLLILASPVHRFEGLEKDPFKVSPMALTYTLTEHTKKLATHANPREDPLYNVPGKVAPGALKVKASFRIEQLAKPAERPPGLETDLKEDAFSVPKLALKAKCTPRLKELAQPRFKVKRRR